jgi:flagellar biogenesis protein FliO
LSATIAAGQATRPAGADTDQAAPATAPASTGQVPQQHAPQGKASEGSSVEAQPIRRDTTPSASSSTSGGAARRDGSGKPVVPPPVSPFDFRRVALALGAVVGLIFLLHWVAKRLFPGVAAARAMGAVRVLGRSVISPKQQILLIQVGRRVLVVGDSGAQMNALAQIDDADEIAALLGQIQNEKPGSSSAFGGLFGTAQSRFGEEPPDEQKKVVDEDEREEHVVPTQQTSSPPPELGLSDVRGELVGLMDRVKQLSQQFRKS